MKTRHETRFHASVGIALPEVLITLLVLSIGLLGLAALQTRALRLGDRAEMLNLAVQLTEEIGERMRANPAGVRRGEYRMERDRLPEGSAGMTRTDLLSWRTELAGLPAGTGEIRPCSPAAYTLCAGSSGHIVTVYWNAARDPDASSYHCPPRSAADYSCYRFLVP